MRTCACERVCVRVCVHVCVCERESECARACICACVYTPAFAEKPTRLAKLPGRGLETHHGFLDDLVVEYQLPVSLVGSFASGKRLETYRFSHDATVV